MGVIKRRRYTPEEIARILRDAEVMGVPEAARKHKVTQKTIYTWRKKWGGMSAAEIARLKALERENARLKRMLAERELEIELLKEILEGNLGPRRRGRGWEEH